MKYTVLAEHVGVATVVGWEKALGQYVALGDVLLTLRTTDGTELPVLSPTYGVLFKRSVLTQEAVEAGEPLAVLAGVTEPQAPVASDPEQGYVPVGPEEKYTPPLRWQRLALHHAASLAVAPHQYTTLTVNLAEVERLQARTQAPLAAFVSAATAAALKRFPLFNAAWLADDDLRLRKEVHLALPQPDGTFPVVRDADSKSVMSLARELAACAALPQQGATFTLTLGTADSQTPILHQPQTGHLYLGERGLLCLAHDARVADGFAATDFLRTVALSLEEAQFLFV